MKNQIVESKPAKQTLVTHAGVLKQSDITESNHKGKLKAIAELGLRGEALIQRYVEFAVEHFMNDTYQTLDHAHRANATARLNDLRKTVEHIRGFNVERLEAYVTAHLNVSVSGSGAKRSFKLPKDTMPRVNEVPTHPWNLHKLSREIKKDIKPELRTENDVVEALNKIVEQGTKRNTLEAQCLAAYLIKVAHSAECKRDVQKAASELRVQMEKAINAEEK